MAKWGGTMATHPPRRTQALLSYFRAKWAHRSIHSHMDWIFNHLKVCLADAIHNFKWVKIIQIWQNRVLRFPNTADLYHADIDETLP